MREIDLLPEWYKSNKRRQVSYRSQYIAFCGLLSVMVVWNFVLVHSVSEEKRELAQLELKRSQLKSISQRVGEVKSEVAHLRRNSDLLEKVDSKVDIANVLAEISFLLDDNIVLSRLDFMAETFDGEKKGKAKGGSAVRTARTRLGNMGKFLFGDVRFKVVLQGVAANAGDVAELICRLEDSAYFFRAIPSYSRNKQLQAAGASEEGYQVSEFEIGCYLANYQLEENYLAKSVESGNQ